MTRWTPPHDERLQELLIDRATQGLTSDEQREFEALMTDGSARDVDDYDRVAAAIEVAFLADALDEPPPGLTDRLEAAAAAWHGAHAPAPPVPSAPPHRSSEATRTPSAAGRLAPWLVAAAAVIMAVIAWRPDVAPTVDPALAYAELATHGDAIVAPFTPTDPSSSATGEIVWVPSAQRGYMKFTGVGVNDPTEVQYQLWIFDAARRTYSDAIAVDGGVFDIPETATVIVPIRAALPVEMPELFAITTEPPGGVVRHNPDADPQRFRIVLTAPATMESADDS